LLNISQLKKGKEAGTNKQGAGTKIKGCTERGKFVIRSLLFLRGDRGIGSREKRG